MSTVEMIIEKENEHSYIDIIDIKTNLQIVADFCICIFRHENLKDKKRKQLSAKPKENEIGCLLIIPYHRLQLAVHDLG